MPRSWTYLVIVAAFLAAPNAAMPGGGKGNQKEIRQTGSLQNQPKDAVREAPGKIHVVPLKKGKTYEILMVGMGFDAYLRLEDPSGKQLDEDDDSGGMLNALIVFPGPKDGDYRIVCTAFSPNINGGNYLLTVKETGSFKELPAGLSTLSDKPAPELKGDFVLNGKADKLADFQGKVVLLHFWAVQSVESVNTLPRLCDLYTTHKTDGLEVVSITYYNSELGHKFAFDAAEGKLIKLDSASPKTDQAMLAAFARHYKLEHPLFVLNKENALKAYNDYLVNGLPQIVLIDRQGRVRFSFAGEARSRSEEIDTQIRKLLAEQ